MPHHRSGLAGGEGYLCRLNISPRTTHRNVHDLGELIRLLDKSGQTVPQTIRLTARLSDFAVAARYPGTSEPVTREEYDECLVLATKALRWVEELLVNP
jgi:HEPN domain-containing protein